MMPGVRLAFLALAVALAACAATPAPIHVLPLDANPMANTDPLWTPQPHRDRPRAVCVSPDATKAWVMLAGVDDDPGTDDAVIDLATGQPVKRVHLDKAPWQCAVDPSGKYVVVTLRFADHAIVLDAATDAEVARVPVPYYTETAIFRADGQRLYLANRWKDSVLWWNLDLTHGFAVQSTNYDDAAPEEAMGTHLSDNPGTMALSSDGKRLFVGESDFETLNNVLKAEVPAPSELNPDVPKELDAIVLKALSREREDRQADCAAFAGELRRWYYSSVADPDAASLKGYMHELFADDIAQLRTDVAAEVAMMEQLRRNGLPAPGSNSQQRRIVTGSQPAARGIPDERTIALDSSPNEHTLALPDGIASASHVQRGQTNLAPTAKSRTGWYVGVGVGAAVLAAIAVIAAGGGSKPAKGDAPGTPSAAVDGAVATKPHKIGIRIHAPGAQQILVDDNPICTEPDCDFGGEQGKTVKILARAGERMKIVYHKLDQDGATVEVKIPEPATPTALAVATGPVVIVHVEPANATVTVNDHALALSNSNAKVVDAKLGDTLHVEAKAEGYRSERQDFVVKNPQIETFVLSLEKEKEKRTDSARTAPAEPGKIVVTAQPWAKVSAKGKDLGLTPVKTELPAGKYALTLTKGDTKKTVSVVVKPGQTATVNVDMRTE